MLCRLPTDEAWEQSEALGCAPSPAAQPHAGQLPEFKVNGGVDILVGLGPNSHAWLSRTWQCIQVASVVLTMPMTCNAVEHCTSQCWGCKFCCNAHPRPSRAAAAESICCDDLWSSSQVFGPESSHMCLRRLAATHWKMPCRI